MKRVAGLAAWLLPCFAAAPRGAVAPAQAITLYEYLAQMAWPPSSLFEPVWSALYAAMGVAAWLVWREGGWRARRGVLARFVIPLAINALWRFFCAWHHDAWAFVHILQPSLPVAATPVGFWRVRTLAGVLLLPCLGWVGSATALKSTVWQLNPQQSD
jgi:tryptophan-rich sensory protein